ncbi:threonine/serine exporter family protein [Alkaliphilus crotonatoxidans]
MILVFKHFVYAFMCALGFAVLFNAPRSSLFKSALAGGLGWSVYIISFQLSNSSVLSTFFASLCVGLISEVLAIYYKNPITVYIIPAIIPLVPGYKLYYTMLTIIEKDYTGAANHGSEALMIAVVIAGALTIVLSLNSLRRKYTQRRLLTK